jgi:hypothetical protein
LGPYPFLFCDLADTFTTFPFLRPLIVQEVLDFLAVQDFPPAETLVCLIAAPPRSAGNVKVTVMLTLPFLTGPFVTEVIVGALGFVADLTAACAGAVRDSVKAMASGIEKRFML